MLGSALVPRAGCSVPLQRTLSILLQPTKGRMHVKFVLARRQNQHSGRVRSPEHEGFAFPERATAESRNLFGAEGLLQALLGFLGKAGMSLAGIEIRIGGQGTADEPELVAVAAAPEADQKVQLHPPAHRQRKRPLLLLRAKAGHVMAGEH